MIEPIAWALYWKEGDLCRVVTTEREADVWIKQALGEPDPSPEAFVSPLYAIPSGYKGVPVEPTEARLSAALKAVPSATYSQVAAIYKAMIEGEQ